MSSKPWKCREGYRCLFGDRGGARKPSGKVPGGGTRDDTSSSYFAYQQQQQQQAYDLSEEEARIQSVLFCALFCIIQIQHQGLEFPCTSSFNPSVPSQVESESTTIFESESTTIFESESTTIFVIDIETTSSDEHEVDLVEGVAETISTSSSDPVAEVESSLMHLVEDDLLDTREGSDTSVGSSVSFDQLTDSSEEVMLVNDSSQFGEVVVVPQSSVEDIVEIDDGADLVVESSSQLFDSDDESSSGGDTYYFQFVASYGQPSAGGNNKVIQIIVDDPIAGRAVTVDVAQDGDVTSLMLDIYHKTRMLPRDQMLKFKRKTLDNDGSTLIDLGIGEGSRMTLTSRLFGSGPTSAAAVPSNDDELHLAIALSVKDEEERKRRCSDLDGDQRKPFHDLSNELNIQDDLNCKMPAQPTKMPAQLTKSRPSKLKRRKIPAPPTKEELAARERRIVERDATLKHMSSHWQARAAQRELEKNRSTQQKFERISNELSTIEAKLDNNEEVVFLADELKSIERSILSVSISSRSVDVSSLESKVQVIRERTGLTQADDSMIDDSDSDSDNYEPKKKNTKKTSGASSKMSGQGAKKSKTRRSAARSSSFAGGDDLLSSSSSNLPLKYPPGKKRGRAQIGNTNDNFNAESFATLDQSVDAINTFLQSVEGKERMLTVCESSLDDSSDVDVTDVYATEILPSVKGTVTKVSKFVLDKSSDSQEMVHSLCDYMNVAGTLMEQDALALFDGNHQLSDYQASLKADVLNVATYVDTLLNDRANFDFDKFIIDDNNIDAVTRKAIVDALPDEYKGLLNLAPKPMRKVVALYDRKNYATKTCKGRGAYGDDNAWCPFNSCVNCDTKSVSKFLYKMFHNRDEPPDDIGGGIVGGDLHMTILVKGSDSYLLEQTDQVAEHLGCTRHQSFWKNFLQVAKQAIANLALPGASKLRVKFSSAMAAREVHELHGNDKYLQCVNESPLLSSVYTPHANVLLARLNKDIRAYGAMDGQLRMCINANYAHAYEFVIGASSGWVTDFFNVWGGDQQPFLGIDPGLMGSLAKHMASALVNWDRQRLSDERRKVFDSEAAIHTRPGLMTILRSCRAAQETTSAIGQLAARMNNNEEGIDLSVEATNLGLTTKRLAKRIKGQRSNQNNLADLSRAAAASNRGGDVDVDALARARNKTVSATQISLDNAKQAQNNMADLSRAAAASNRDEVVDIDSLAKARGQSVSHTREKLDNAKQAQSKHGTLNRAAATSNRGGNVDVDTLAKARNEPVSHTKRSLDNTKRNQNKLSTLSRAASAANRDEVVDVDSLAANLGMKPKNFAKRIKGQQRNQNKLSTLNKAAAISNRGDSVDVDALAKARGQSVSHTREKLDNAKQAQNNMADLSRAASLSNRGDSVDIDSLAQARGKSVSHTRRSLDNTKQAQNKFKAKMEDRRKQVVAEYDSTIIGTFAMTHYETNSSRYTKRYSLQARLEQKFNNKAVLGIGRSMIGNASGSGSLLLGMRLRKPHENEQFSAAELKTGFRVNVPAFTDWEKANKLTEITHHDGSMNEKPCEKGTLYRTEYQINRTRALTFRCGCAKGSRCNDGKVLTANSVNAFGIEEKVIPFGNFLE